MADSFSEECHWTFPKDTSLLVELRGLLQNFLDSTTLENKRKLRMIMCVDEAAANIVEHTQPKGNLEEFRYFISASIDEQYLKVIFKDDGEPYDPTKTPEVDLKAHAKSGKKDGLGVQIMRMSLDILEYEYVEGRYNQLTLGMKIEA